ncbi:MAG: DUF805 domain-containing protein [Rugosibacter sp.]|jgi:uncharacterized membrane protein YhaH (DUF805 family)
MLRYSRIRFFVFGVVPALNAIGLLLFGLGLATNGSAGTERAVPLLLVLAGGLLLATCAAAVKRGRDMGWKTAASLAGLVVSAGLGPVFFVLVGYFALAPGNPGENAFGPTAPPISATAWAWSVVAAVVPWFAAVTAARVM